MAKARPSEFGAVFARLRSILQKYAGRLSVTEDSARRFCLEGVPGPAALRAWGGKPRRSTLPVAWAEIGESYVSYHLMGIDGNSTMHVTPYRKS